LAKRIRSCNWFTKAPDGIVPVVTFSYCWSARTK
jgi:hypothetical protein